jgi:hypothetical protein
MSPGGRIRNFHGKDDTSRAGLGCQSRSDRLWNLSWVVQGPVSWCPAREAAMKTVAFEKGDEVAGVFDKSG